MKPPLGYGDRDSEMPLCKPRGSGMIDSWPTWREREKHLFLSVVTGAHYGTKIPPDQQPTKLCAGI